MPTRILRTANISIPFTVWWWCHFTVGLWSLSTSRIPFYFFLLPFFSFSPGPSLLPSFTLVRKSIVESLSKTGAQVSTTTNSSSRDNRKRCVSLFFFSTLFWSFASSRMPLFEHLVSPSLLSWTKEQTRDKWERKNAITARLSSCLLKREKTNLRRRRMRWGSIEEWSSDSGVEREESSHSNSCYPIHQQWCLIIAYWNPVPRAYKMKRWCWWWELCNQHDDDVVDGDGRLHHNVICFYACTSLCEERKPVVRLVGAT